MANYKYTLMIVGFLLLLSPLVPGLGQEIYGSRIWLSIGSYSFQPGEIAKIVIVLFLAGYLAQNREMLSVFTWRVGPLRLPDIRTLLPLLLTTPWTLLSSWRLWAARTTSSRSPTATPVCAPSWQTPTRSRMMC